MPCYTENASGIYQPETENYKLKIKLNIEHTVVTFCQVHFQIFLIILDKYPEHELILCVLVKNMLLQGIHWLHKIVLDSLWNGYIFSFLHSITRHYKLKKRLFSLLLKLQIWRHYFKTPPNYPIQYTSLQ